jgi:hypothetical protein
MGMNPCIWRNVEKAKEKKDNQQTSTIEMQEKKPRIQGLDYEPEQYFSKVESKDQS